MIKFHSRFNHLFIFSIAILISGIFSSCEKEPDALGLGILPNEDNFLLKTDTLSDVLGSTVKLDSVVSYAPADTLLQVYYKSVLGDYTDPLFGNTKANLLLNFFPDSVNHSFGTNPQADSLIFYLRFDSILGDKNSAMNLKISELQKSLSYRKDYYNEDLDSNAYKGNLIYESVVQFTDTMLKIKITNPEFMDKLINAPPATKILDYQEYFKGFYIQAQSVSGQGILAYVNPRSNASFSRMVMHYRNNELGDTSINYWIVTKTVRANNFVHTYSGTPVETALQEPVPGQKITYVQGMAGVGTRIQIPSLSSWVAGKKNLAINQAILVVPVNQAINDTSLLPARLSIMALSNIDPLSNTGDRSLIEYGFGQTFLGGLYDSKNKVYTFNLTKHLHYLVNKQFKNTDFVIVADSYKVNLTNSFSRVSLDFSPGKGARLYVTYSQQ